MSAVLAESLDMYAQLEALPENLIGEILNGQLHTQPRPAGRHVRAHSTLQIEIGGPFDLGRSGPGGWWILIEPEIHFIRDTEVIVPDLAGWRRERLPVLPKGHRFEVVPDWVCEVLSPGTTRTDRAVKMPLYARFGVAYVWLVDPSARTLEAFELREDRWTLAGVFKDDDTVAAPPFAVVPFNLAVLWG